MKSSIDSGVFNEELSKLDKLELSDLIEKINIEM